MNKSTIISIIIGLVLAAVMFFVGRCTAPEPEESIVTKSDTIYLHSTDTIKVPKIEYVDRLILDTIHVTDTILIREQLEYEDSISHIWVSGIEPAIDSIIYFIPKDTVLINTETTITKVELKHHGWGITVGPYVGFGGNYNPFNQTFGGGVEVGLGVSIGYSFLFK